MELMIDSHVAAVLSFMQSNVQASKLAAVANSIHDLARIVWGHFDQSETELVSLAGAPISSSA
jgi:hypothetical protein